MSSTSATTTDSPLALPPLQIGLIGAGMIGGVLAKHFHAAGHEVLLSNSRGPESLKEKAAELGVKAVTSQEAANAKDIVVVTIPQVLTPQLKPLFDDATGSKQAVIIDTNNYYPEVRDGQIPELEQGGVDSVWVSQQIGRPVIKAFNNISFISLESKGKPFGSPDRIALPVAGDDAKHKIVVMALINSIGFDAVDAGDLANSWRQGPGMPCYTADSIASELKKQLAAAEKGKINESRTAANNYIIGLMPDFVTSQKKMIKERLETVAHAQTTHTN